jgi:hypothetical protein
MQKFINVDHMDPRTSLTPDNRPSITKGLPLDGQLEGIQLFKTAGNQSETELPEDGSVCESSSLSVATDVGNVNPLLEAANASVAAVSAPAGAKEAQGGARPAARTRAQKEPKSLKTNI